MRILQISNKFPYPLKDGAAIAITYLAKAFDELGHEVSLLSMNTSKHWFDTATLPPDFNHYQAVYTTYIDNRIRPFPALLNLFTDKSYHIERFKDAGFASKLREILQAQDFDVVQLESVTWLHIFLLSENIRKRRLYCGRTMWNTKCGSASLPIQIRSNAGTSKK